MSAEQIRAGELAAQMVQDAPATDSLPADSGPLWYTIADIGGLPQYREGLQPVTTGFATLDNALRGGFRPECVYVIAGRTGFAKSTLATNMARRVGLHGHSVLLLKLEESPTEATWRMHAAAAQVDLRCLLDGAHNATEERRALIDAWQLIRELPIRISDQRNIYAIERIARAHAEQGGELVILDQLGMIEVPDTSFGYERVTVASNLLRHLARNLRLPIVVVCQVNRPAAKGKDRLTCNDLRDSGAIENDAAGVILIDAARRSDGPCWHTDPFNLELIVDKNRYGPRTDPEHPLELLWWPRCCRIEDAHVNTAEERTRE